MSNNYDKPLFLEQANNSLAERGSDHSLPAYGIPEDDKPRGGGILSKILIAILAIATGGLGYYTYSLNKDRQATESELTSQKKQVMSDLKLLRESYDKVVIENKDVKNDLLQARNKIDQYIDSLQNMKVSISSLARFKSQAFTLAKERDLLIRKNDSLMRANSAIKKDLDSVSVKLDLASAKVDSLARQTNQLKKVVETGSALQISKLIAEAVKGSKNKTTDRGKAADKLKICFTVGANKIAKSGSRYFYIQVNSPSGTILGSNESFSSGSESVKYSTATHFIYDNKSVDICDFIAKVGKEFEKGTYKVIVYDDKLNQVGTTDLLLK
ncbi:hypothetical protein [Capnocytophaga sputigena]|uniref:hypothetical protein n=1 Tax=Capnocytophaga sputigena TaxID=1019 RepID=UPI0028E601E0|nr:hypothetical protein [Capnocytophaga sputigena]